MLLKIVVLSLLLLLLAVNTASLAKIAGFAAVGGSGYINMRNIMEELASRGHEVHLYRIYTLWFKFILGLNFIFHCFNYHTLPFPKTKGNKI